MVRKRGKTRISTATKNENSSLPAKSKDSKQESIPWRLLIVSVFFSLLSLAAFIYRHQINDITGIVLDLWSSRGLDPAGIESHQNVSLFKRYAVNYTEMLRQRLQNFKKYDYVYNLNGVDKRSNLSLEEYRDVYDGKWPVVLNDVVTGWQAFSWSGSFFKENYGEENVVVKIVHGEESDVLALPIDLFYKQANKAREYSWNYVVDEFFILQRPELSSSIGETVMCCNTVSENNLIYLKEDFYALFPREVRPWNAQLLWGTAFSRSSLHIDPYNWTGTNAVIRGLKRWKLYPPGQDEYLYVTAGGYCGFPLECKKYNSEVDAFNPDLEKFPKFVEAKAIEFDQLPGELLFIPTGWFHQAYNVEETIAISSQVMNRNNYRIVLEEILKLNRNLKRSNLPYDVDTLPPDQQVKVVMAMLSNKILQQGDTETERNLALLKQGHEDMLLSFPVQAAIRIN